jgi:uncharacterized RDD family membrane protein YckC
VTDSLHKTLWKRVLAMWGDGVIFETIALFWLVPSGVVTTPAWQEAGLLALNLAFFGYRVLAHAFVGQTVGKRLANVRVVSITESGVTVRQALARESLLLTMGAISILAGAARAIFGQRMPAPIAGLLGLLTLATCAALLADPLVAIVHPRRRALHDLIAGTVVIRCDRAVRASV